MKQITVSIPESKFLFFLELIKHLDFVKVESIDTESTFEAIKENIKRGLHEVEMIEKGEIKATTLQDFFDEI
jgi:hypothetical protein